MTANPPVQETVTVPAKGSVKVNVKAKADPRLTNPINPLKKQVVTAPDVRAVVLVPAKAIVFPAATLPAPASVKGTARVYLPVL